jgi:hypothetical protein
MERASLYQLIEMCKMGNEAAKQELKRRWNLDWDQLREEVERNDPKFRRNSKVVS